MPFRHLLKFFDRSLRILGPILIVAATVLISLCVYIYFSILLPRRYPDDIEWTWASRMTYGAHLILAFWFVILIAFNYFSAVLVGPGHPNEDTGRLLSAHEQPDGENSIVIDITQGDASSSSSQRPSTVPAGTTRRCTKCSMPKPVRTHHCSVCNRCNFKMDHHCPWINVCSQLVSYGLMRLDLCRELEPPIFLSFLDVFMAGYYILSVNVVGSCGFSHVVSRRVWF